MQYKERRLLYFLRPQIIALYGKQHHLSLFIFLQNVFSVFSLQSSEDSKHNDESPQEDEGFMGMSPLLQAHHAMERMEEFVCKVRVCGNR